MPHKILIVDDEPNITSSFSSLLTDEGHDCLTAGSAEEANQLLEASLVDLILLDLNLPGQSGLEFLRQLRSVPEVPSAQVIPAVLVVSGQSDIPTALEAVRLGAVDYLEKPVVPERLISTVRSTLMLTDVTRQRNLLVDSIDDDTQIIGESAAMRKLCKIIDQVAATDVTVLITGENGTGKELVATRLFLGSQRRGKPFVKVNCPGIPATLFESELFGHRKGAFTGAVKDYPGKFVLADRGTIFLDEIGDLPLECQAKLLRVLESGEVETLGSSEQRRVDVRVICATNRDLVKLVSDRQFREDLYYRISVMPIIVPPLRQRRDDIPLLIGEFLRRLDPSGDTTFAPDATAWLASLDYPGNIRELRNLIERATILFSGKQVQAADISPLGDVLRPTSAATSSLSERVATYERFLIEQTLAGCDGNISEAARQLRVDRANLSKKIKEHNPRSK